MLMLAGLGPRSVSSTEELGGGNTLPRPVSWWGSAGKWRMRERSRFLPGWMN